MGKVRLKEVLDLFGTSDAGQNDLTIVPRIVGEKSSFNRIFPFFNKDSNFFNGITRA